MSLKHVFALWIPDAGLAVVWHESLSTRLSFIKRFLELVAKQKTCNTRQESDLVP